MEEAGQTWHGPEGQWHPYKDQEKQGPLGRANDVSKEVKVGMNVARS